VGAMLPSPSPINEMEPSQGAQRSDTIVRAAGAPRHPGGGTLVQDLSIGSETTGPDYQFTRIMAVFPARDGTIWVLDGPEDGPGLTGPREYRLRRFDASGKFLSNVSRMGEGPGELFRPESPIAQLPDGPLVVRDGVRNRVNVFNPSGTVAPTWAFGQTRLRSASISLGAAITVDTMVISWLPTYIDPPFVPGPRRPDAPSSVPIIVRVGPQGRIIDTLRLPELPDVELPRPVVEYPISGAAAGRGGAPPPGGAARAATPPAGPARTSRITYSVPYSPTAAWYTSPLGYFVTMITSRYALDLRIPPAAPRGRAGTPPAWREGDPVVSIRRNVAPVTVSAAERRDKRARLDSVMKLRPGSSITVPVADLPTAKPAIRSVTFGAEGRMWVMVAVPSARYDSATHGAFLSRSALAGGGWIEPIVYDVFEPLGVYVGQVQVPTQVSPRSMRGDALYAVHVDGDGVQSVRRYRVAWR